MTNDYEIIYLLVKWLSRSVDDGYIMGYERTIISVSLCKFRNNFSIIHHTIFWSKHFKQISSGSTTFNKYRLVPLCSISMMTPVSPLIKPLKSDTFFNPHHEKHNSFLFSCCSFFSFVFLSDGQIRGAFVFIYVSLKISLQLSKCE